MRSLLEVDVSVAVLEIQRHIHRIGIALHLDGSMSSVPDTCLPLDALVLVTAIAMFWEVDERGRSAVYSGFCT